jgi:hypothetical protein
MRNAIQNRTYRNAVGPNQARVNVIGTDVLRKDLADALFHARHVAHPRGAQGCLVAGELVGLTLRRLPQAKQATASAARSLEAIRSSMSGPQRWLAERGSRAFVASA